MTPTPRQLVSWKVLLKACLAYHDPLIVNSWIELDSEDWDEHDRLWALGLWDSDDEMVNFLQVWISQAETPK